MSIMKELKKNWHRFTFAVDRNKPTLYFAAGIVGVGFTIYTVARGTWKAKDIVEDSRSEIEEIEQQKEDEVISEEEAKAQIKKVRVHEGVELVKAYAAPAAIGTASMGCLFASNNTWKKRYAGTTAALAAVTEGYNVLKNGVLDKFGEDILKELTSPSDGAKDEEVVDEETGEITTKSKRIVNPEKVSPYAKFFTRSNPYYNGVKDFDMNFIKAQQRFANEKVRAYGHMTLNDAYRDLGLKDTKAGMVVGWIYDKHDHGEGDNFIEYICEEVVLANEDGEFEPAIMIDFNVDGDIYSRLE